MGQWWQISKTDAHCYQLRLTFQKARDIKRLCLLADIHWDSAHCRLDLLKQCLDEAVSIGAPIVIAGDFFDAMQGKWDVRASQDTLRPEHRGGNYLDLLVSTAAEWLRPYAKNIAMISYGNHETSIKKKHETDLLQRLCQELRREGSPVECGPYWGFLQLICRIKDNASSQMISLHYHHGYGGGGEVTRGNIDHSRTRGMYFADVFLSGHIHRRNQDENIITMSTVKGQTHQRKQLFLRASSWKDESGDGWHVQQGRAARPIGGWWLEITPTVPIKNYVFDYRAIPT